MRDADGLSRDYNLLTPEERFRLVLAASGRGDEAERDRLVRAGGKLVLSFPDHAPFAQALLELSYLTFMELLDAAAFFTDVLARADGLDDESPTGEAARGRRLDLALAAGYVLNAKAAGWALFRERLGVPPMLLWEPLPGCGRLRRVLGLAEGVAFTPEEMLAWLNRPRPEGAPAPERVALTPEAVADANEREFRERARWWGG